jgi:hypothetical protein
MIVNETSGVNYPFVGYATRNSNTTVDTLPVGSVAIVNEAGTVQTSSIAATTDEYRIVKKTANGPVFSPRFKYAEIVSKGAKNFEQAQEQVTVIGYDPTSAGGSLSTVTSGSTWKLSLDLINTMGYYNSSSIIKDPVYTTQAATEADLVKGIVNNAISNFKAPRAAAGTLEFNRTSNGTLADFTGTGTLLKFTKGSTLVSTYIKAAAGDATLTASTMSTSVGDIYGVPSTLGRTFTFTANILGTGAGRHIIYIGATSYDVADAGSADQNATAIAAAINAGTQASATAATSTVTIAYKPNFYALPPVVWYTADDSSFTNVTVTIASGNTAPVRYVAATAASSAASFTLDIPWQGETGYVIGGTTAATHTGVVSSVTAWGIKINGLPQTIDQFNPATDLFRKVRFKASLKNLTANTATSTITEAVAAKEGSGMLESVAVIENNGGFKKGREFISAYPPTVYATDALTYAKGQTYSAASLKWDTLYITFNRESGVAASIGQSVKQPITLEVYTPSSLSYEELETVLAITAVS